MNSQVRPAPRIRRLDMSAGGDFQTFAEGVRQAAALGFDHILLGPAYPGVTGEADEASALSDAITVVRQSGLRPLLEIDLARFSAAHPLVGRHGDAFTWRADGRWLGPHDPREAPRAGGVAVARLHDAAAAGRIGAWAMERLGSLSSAGVGGFCFRRPDPAAASMWRELIARTRNTYPDALFIADSRGMAREAALGLAGLGFDHLVSSLQWWDGRAAWLVREYEDLRRVAPLLAEIGCEPGSPGQPALAAAIGAGLIVHGAIGEAGDAVAAANRLVPTLLATHGGELRQLTSPAAPLTALLRVDTADARDARDGLLILINTGAAPAPLDMAAIGSVAGLGFGPFQHLGGASEAPCALAPGEARLLRAELTAPVLEEPSAAEATASAAARGPRLVIEGLTPTVQGGDFPVKRTVGETVEVEADVFADGHTALAADLLWRPRDDALWRVTPMEALANDRWATSFRLERLGRWEFTVEAWVDVYGGLAADLAKKAAAGVVKAVDIEEARARIVQAAARADDPWKADLDRLAARLKAAPSARRLALLTAPETVRLMRQADERPFRLRLDPAQSVDAERLSARFASWYELFPRSQGVDAAHHGTFEDVIARLPAIRGMGFDVVYLTPIHPIGRAHRKGRDNSLTAGPDDPGSPYAIGAPEGGHDAIHPELGDLASFQRLIAAAREQGLEVALDFAIQCSPDHPWLKAHPEWFDWRSDGTIRYAENPPKTYEDIVNVDFYRAEAIPDLWIALRDIVRFWVGQGIRTFRVDNPHTKPLPFWAWLIGEVRGAAPEVIFLSEAFTRPKPMYRLAKIGFSQSYTYFTWRHGKRELTDYLRELTTTEVREFFRPHFFVNTPDINPYFLQTSGRAGFLIRAALAATLSGLWGMYSGFELLESEPVPGKEEYKSSEKYEIKPRDWRAPGNIIAEITELNLIRKTYPALQTHLGVRFYTAFDDQVLYYGKAEAGMAAIILVAVSLDPHAPRETAFEAPLWEFGLPDDGVLAAEDLILGQTSLWRGKIQRVRLTPEAPYAIWCVRPEETRP